MEASSSSDKEEDNNSLSSLVERGELGWRSSISVFPSLFPLLLSSFRFADMFLLPFGLSFLYICWLQCIPRHVHVRVGIGHHERASLCLSPLVIVWCFVRSVLSASYPYWTLELADGRESKREREKID